MAKNKKQSMKTEGQIIKALRGERSFRGFVTYLNENIPAGMPGITSFQSVWNWENNLHPVTGECLMAWMQFYLPEDPRHQLAKDVFALRMKRVHWIGGDESGFGSQLSETDGKKLLKRVKVKA